MPNIATLWILFGGAFIIATAGKSKELEINGVGYRAAKEGKNLVMNLGYSHQVIVPEIDGITIEVPQPNQIVVSGCDKQKVGQFAAEIREKRPPEPYKGKGIKYADEVIRRKDYAEFDEYDSAVTELLKSKDVDLVVLAGFMTILGKQFISAFENRIINIHPSLIPSFCGEGYYGLRVHEEALNRGVKVTGATAHFVNEVCDGGPIIIQKAVEIQNGDTPEILQKRVMEPVSYTHLTLPTIRLV